MAIETKRYSPVVDELNARLPDGISKTELEQLKQMAQTGSVQLLDVTTTEKDVAASTTLTASQKAQVQGALQAMRDILAAGPQNADAGVTMEWFATLDPFARARADLFVA